MEIELPRPEKRRRRTEDQNLVQDLKNQILAAVKNAPKPPAKVARLEPLDPEVITSLTKWADSYKYVLHYKVKRKFFDDVPGDVRHEGRYAPVYTIELYWVDIE